MPLDDLSIIARRFCSSSLVAKGRRSVSSNAAEIIRRPLTDGNRDEITDGGSAITLLEFLARYKLCDGGSMRYERADSDRMKSILDVVC
jgi:hypothetical protein